MTYVTYSSPFVLIISLLENCNINKVNFLYNRQSKQEFIYDIYIHDPILSDDNLLDIYNRVESLLRIIKGNKVVDALKMVTQCDTNTIYDIYARQEAIYLLSLIKKNKISLPKFD